MLTKIQKWGNSQGIRIPKNLLKNTQIQIGEEVDIIAQVGKIIIESTNKIHGRYSIDELAKKCQMNTIQLRKIGVHLLERRFGKCLDIFLKKVTLSL